MPLAAGHYAPIGNTWSTVKPSANIPDMLRPVIGDGGFATVILLCAIYACGG
jgi:hypothetical protein